MTLDRPTRIAVELQQLGVSQAGVVELLSSGDLDEIERQLNFLPYRKAKRPEALIIEAVRKRYSPPKEFFHASTQAPAPTYSSDLHQDPELPPGYVDAIAQGHGTANPPHSHPSNHGVEPGGDGYALVIPDLDQEDGPAERGD